MPRYIDADALLERLPNDLPYKASVKRVLIQAPTADVVESKAIEQLKWERDTAIEQLKSYGVGFGEKADVVNVVRCKDCVYWENGKDYTPYCNEPNGLIEPNADDFCSYGERKEK